ncbi:hypothetical protein FOXB_00651 [Fusarium oxysporum f. sp. conglutinans Fo5176]|uniref:F-box domain-containing protein n=1 Tax=Fusarium oxysporum (strain Fo5176) TaxID=660025 RepID=F9F2M7_FUSOF|nr:hypothetical protein FOXB_00651 [Fusarium oxysporum f. sp. conglutinans Fo5176]
MANQTTQQHRMRLRSSGCLRWSYLPQEIRRNILDTIVDQRNPRWSALASVSKEWQSVIGTRNMAKLNLRPSCLEDFEQAVVRQRDLVRHIYLNVELTEYKCTLCKNKFAVTIAEKNNRLMSKAVTKLLTILSTWNTTGPLTLELNASSASDSKHWFKNFRFNDEHDAPYSRDSVIPMEGMHSDWHDPKHGWENGVRVKPPPISANKRLFGLINLNGPPYSILNVNAVTRFMIRRQFRHRLGPREFASLLSKFSRLTDLVYEPWPQKYTDSYRYPCTRTSQHRKAVFLRINHHANQLVHRGSGIDWHAFAQDSQKSNPISGLQTIPHREHPSRFRSFLLRDSSDTLVEVQSPWQCQEHRSDKSETQ